GVGVDDRSRRPDVEQLRKGVGGEDVAAAAQAQHQDLAARDLGEDERDGGGIVHGLGPSCAAVSSSGERRGWEGSASSSFDAVLAGRQPRLWAVGMLW